MSSAGSGDAASRSHDSPSAQVSTMVALLPRLPRNSAVWHRWSLPPTGFDLPDRLRSHSLPEVELDVELFELRLGATHGRGSPRATRQAAMWVRHTS